jgi:small subunit ribosomal protein S20
MKTAERDRLKNRKTKSNLRGAIRDFKEEKKPDEKAAGFKELVSILDTAARRRVIHKNKAARTKSRLSKMLKSK